MSYALSYAHAMNEQMPMQFIGAANSEMQSKGIKNVASALAFGSSEHKFYLC